MEARGAVTWTEQQRGAIAERFRPPAPDELQTALTPDEAIAWRLWPCFGSAATVAGGLAVAVSDNRPALLQARLAVLRDYGVGEAERDVLLFWWGEMDAEDLRLTREAVAKASKGH